MLRHLARNEQGNVAILFAAGLSLGVALAAFAVDEASLYLEKRELQAAVDIAAIQATRDPAQAEVIVLSSLQEAGIVPPDLTYESIGNAVGGMQLDVEVGHYRPDPSVPHDERFTVGAGPTNAVKVRYARTGRQFFSAGWTAAPTIGVEGTAAVTPQVALSIGSRLASLQGGAVNAVLNQLLGADVELSLVDYNALAGAQVGVFSFLDALANQIGISAGTYGDVLAAEARQGDIAAALASLLNGVPKAAARTIANSTTRVGSFVTERLLGVGPLASLSTGNGAALGASLSALELLMASAALGNGENQVALNISAGVPGLTNIATSVSIGEPPQSGHWFGIGAAGTAVRTSQIRIRLRANLLGGPVLLNAGVSVPIGIDVAHAEATVASATCPTDGAPNGTAVIAARPGIVRLFIGNGAESGGFVSDVTHARILDVLLLKVDARAVVDVAQPDPAQLSFSSSDIGAGQIKTAATTSIVGSLSQSLISGADIRVQILGIGLGTPGVIISAVRSLLTPLAPVLDDAIGQILGLLGVSIGEADVRVHRVLCSNAVLVS